jgi:hypothetical protein
MTLMLERRRYPRFSTWLPLRLTAVGGKIEPAPLNFLTQNISKAGVCFLAPRQILPGEFIEVEVTLFGVGPTGKSKDVHISGSGRVVRVQAGIKPGWYKLAAAFSEPPTGDESDWHTLAAEFEE